MDLIYALQKHLDKDLHLVSFSDKLPPQWSSSTVCQQRKKMAAVEDTCSSEHSNCNTQNQEGSLTCLLWSERDHQS